MLFERAVASEGTKRMRLAVLLLCLVYGWAQEEVKEIIGAAEMAEIDAEFGGNASMMSNVTFTENGGNATTVPDATITETGGSAVVVPPTTSPKDIDFDEVDKRKGETLNELFRGMTVCTGSENVTEIVAFENASVLAGGCDVFSGHLWIDTKNETLPSSISRLRLVQGCITVWNSGLRELNLSSLSLLIYNERRCRPYVLRFVDNENLRSITFHENFTMPDSHLLLVAGKHSLTEESITPRMEGYRLPTDSDDCRDKKRGCKVYYGDYLYSGDDERLSTLERIEGRLVIHNTSLTNLSKFEKITVVGLYGPALKITDNSNLTDISSLYKMKIRGPEPILEWRRNGRLWCRGKLDLKLLIRITQDLPYNLGTLEWYEAIDVKSYWGPMILEELKERCSCGCGVRGSLRIHGWEEGDIDLTPLKNIYHVGSLAIRFTKRLYDLRFLENLNSIGKPSADMNSVQFKLLENADLIDAYMENLVKIHGKARLDTCYDLPERTVKLFKDLTRGRADFARDGTGRCSSELIEKETERERIVDPRPRNQSEPEKSCFAGNVQELNKLLEARTRVRMEIITYNLSQEHGNHTICEHFYGHLKVHDRDARHAISFIQELKKITGCLDIVYVPAMNTISKKGNIVQSNFEELDLTNLTEIDYDAALCGNFFALHIRKNEFLRRIDFNENLILNGAYFIRSNAKEMEIYSGGKPNSTILWNDPADCLLDDPTEKLRNCTGLIGTVDLGRLSPTLHNLLINKTIKKIHGQIIMSSTDNTNLDAYGYLTIIAHKKDAVIIENNRNLIDISALTKMNITLPKNFPKEALPEWKPVVLRNNGKICVRTLREEKILQKKISTPNQLSDYCRKRCAGGIVTDLTRLRSCQIVMGGLTIKDYDFESASDLLRYFEEIEDIEGQLIIMNNTGIKNLAFLKSLLRVSDYTTKRPIFRVADNPNLTSIEPLHKVELEYSSYEVHLVAVIETYSKISDHEQKELGKQGKVEFRVKERLHPTKGRRAKRKRDRKENADNLGVGIALSVGGCLIITIFGYGYSFFAYLREQRELKRRQQPGGGQAAPVERAP